MTSIINASISSNGIVSTADASGILQIQSNGKNTNAQAWVQFVGSTAVISKSYNVSSITRASAGLYTINFTNALTDANYAIGGSCGTGGNNTTIFSAPSNTPTTTACQIVTCNTAASNIDYAYVSVIFFD